jgi:hypothetical protein
MANRLEKDVGQRHLARYLHKAGEVIDESAEHPQCAELHRESMSVVIATATMHFIEVSGPERPVTRELCMDPGRSAAPADTPGDRALQAAACGPDSRMATITTGDLELLFITSGDRAAFDVVHPGEGAHGSAEPPPATPPRSYWLWALDRSGTAIGGWDVSHLQLVQAARLSEATDVALSLETSPVAASPSQLISRARLHASPYRGRASGAR